jgi:hypothetical protein
VKERQLVLPKQPGVIWPGQKRPVGFDLELVPVVTGLRFALTVPRSTLPSVPPGGQSFERPCEFVVVHVRVARAPWPGLRGHGAGCLWKKRVPLVSIQANDGVDAMGAARLGGNRRFPPVNLPPVN